MARLFIIEKSIIDNRLFNQISQNIAGNLPRDGSGGRRCGIFDNLLSG